MADLFTRFWRRLAAPLNQRIATPAFARFEKYHSLETGEDNQQGEKGIGLFSTTCIVVNMVMGCGFLALPSAFHDSGLVLGSIVLVIVTVLMTGTGFFEAEIMCRAELVMKARLKHKNVSQLKGNIADELKIGKHAFPMVELSEIFGSQRLKGFYTLSLVLLCFSAAWSYASVFGNAFAAYIPVPFLNSGGTCEKTDSTDSCMELYRFYILLFGIIAIPLSTLGVKEQELFQVVMTFLRFTLVVAMVGTTVQGLVTDTAVFGDVVKEDNISSTNDLLSLFRFQGLWSILSTSIFAQCLNTNISVVVHDMRDKARLGTALASGMAVTCCFYLAIALAVATFFQGGVASSCNVNWYSYHGGYPGEGARPWWAAALSGFVVTFPALDVLSVYPLNALIMAQNLMAFVYHDRVDKAEEDAVIKTTFRLAAALPPLLCALSVSNLVSILDYAGATVCLVSFIIPPYLNQLSIKHIEDEFETTKTRTPFSTLFSYALPSKILIILGWVLFVGIIVMTAQAGG